jgi:type IV secretory pathway VirJ component
MTTTGERLQQVRLKIDAAMDAVRNDPGASPVLVAVVEEFARKAEKAAATADERLAVVELEQAGDSAKAAVEADPGVAPTTRDAVLDAHLAICIAKAKLDL